MVFSLFKRELRSSLIPTCIIAAVLALYGGVIVSMYDPELGESLALMREAMPELFAAFGMEDQGATLLEFLVNYLYGFLLVVFPLVLIALLVNRLVVRHVERGTISYLLAQPVGRGRLIFSQLTVLLVCLCVLMVAFTAYELVLSGALFPGELEVGELIAANVPVLCLWLFFAGVCWLTACALPNMNAARWAGVALCVVCILLQMLSDVGDAMEWLSMCTPLALFDPLGFAQGESSALLGAALLAALGAVLAGLGAVVFSRRDLSV